MNLPHYFLADAMPELDEATIAEACRALKRNRERYLADKPVAQIVNLLGDVASSWLAPDNQYRKLALEYGPRELGFSRETVDRGLDGFFREITSDKLRALIVQDFGHEKRPDEFCATATEEKTGRASMVTGPELLVQITAGNIPNSALMGMVLGLLMKSAQFIKCASGTSLLPRLFAHSLREADTRLGACIEVAEWSGGTKELEDELFSHADCVTATGSDETLKKIRDRLPVEKKFLGYGHMISFGYVTREVLSGFNPRKAISRAADDVAAWDQLGCLSPHVIYVEHGGGISAEQFAEALVHELEEREKSAPRGKLPMDVATTIASRRSFYEVRAASSKETRMWCSRESTAWTVIYEADAKFQGSCLHRFIYVKGVGNLTEALQNADNVRGAVSAVGVAATEDRTIKLATELGRWGVTRVCELGKMQDPSLLWRHDGKPALGDLAIWTDWEQG